MNPSNPFGSPRGAFQAPSSSVKSNLFQTSFGQQGSTSQTQNMSFLQPSGFGQSSAMNQPSAKPLFGQAPAFGQTSTQPPSLSSMSQAPAFGQTSTQPPSLSSMSQAPAFGQTSTQPPSLSSMSQAPAFGQTSTQPPSLSSMSQAPAFGQQPAQSSSLSNISQAPAFGQTSMGMSSSVFGGGKPPAFGQSTGLNQGSVFSQTPAFGQTPSAFGQAPGFGKAPPAFGQQSSGFGNSQMITGSTATTLGQPQPLSFGRSVFGQPSSTSVSTGVFGSAQNVTQNRGFGSTEFSFKPANEALFKPIFSASPEPANPQTTTAFGSHTESSASSFSLLTAAKSGPLGFSFSQPAVPSISVQNNTSTSTGTTATPQFTFSQPTAPSSSATTEPTAPSSFSFATKTFQTQPAVASGGPAFGQPAFGDIKPKTETATDVQGDTNFFARSSKAGKRKDEPAPGGFGSEKPIAEEEVPTDPDSPRHPSKRPLIRSRGLPGGLFGRALSGIRRERTNPVRRDVSNEPQKQTQKWKETEPEDDHGQGDELADKQSKVMRNAAEKQEESDSTAPSGSPTQESTSKPRRGRTESLESLTGVSPSDQTILHCKNVPDALNNKQTLEKHFRQAGSGKVSKVICQPGRNGAIVHFEDHATAAKAKKRGKMLHGNELLLVWRKKKQSPAEKGSRSAPAKETAEETNQEVPESKATSSPLRRPALRAAPVGSLLSFSSPGRKMSPVKVLQFDTEPAKETTSEPPSLERPVLSSLLPLIGQVAETTEEKYRLLEQRDKILRQGRPKRTDLLLSSVFVGTCPDMCPEKERYMRETRNQLSVFEVIPETEMVDHSAAIKEYSRSSADQEEPLPHELRPLAVLSRTMDYLVTQIMDQVQDSYRDWYDFVWNRTRGIRKDIIQQHLCCPHTVSLIEKCARFHVHCAHHLCEEPMMSFDAKINNENLTKCLQSLKEMYEDLATQQVFCSHEAEFRQYSVLLKLNDGDILREVQQFRHEIRNSPEVKFAVQAFAAVNSNNFVRFFKLVKKASYLSCCLLHRYFNQVRAKALKALNLAHTVGPRPTPFPVDDVVRMLMFRDAAEATDFLQQYGLYVSDGVVELSRTAFQEPELPLAQKKSEVILAKKVVLVGEVVNGGTLPNPPRHRPVCSFDSQNKYRGDGPPSYAKVVAANAELASARNVDAAPPVAPPANRDEIKEPTQPADAQQVFQPVVPLQPVRPPSPPPKPQPAFSAEDILPVVDALVDEVVGAEAREVAQDGARYAAAALTESGEQLESLVDVVLKEMLREISSGEIQLERERAAEEKRKLEEARRKQEHEAFLAQFSSTLCTEILHQVLDESVRETAAAEIREAADEEARRVASCTEQVCGALVDETLDADVALLAEEFLAAELQRIHKYIKRWRDVVAVRRQLKRQMCGFPAAPCCVDPRFKLKALAPTAPPRPCMADLARGVVNLGNSGVLALSSTRSLQARQEVIHQMKVHFFYQQLLEQTAWTPLDLPALVAENLPDPPERIFWKALLLLPSDQEGAASPADRILSEWLEVKLGDGREPEEKPGGVLQTLCISNSLQLRGRRTHKVHVTVKASRGPLTEDGLCKVEESCELQGTEALVLLLPAESSQEERDVPLLSALLQLKQLQKANSWHCPLPLLVLVPGPDLGESDKLEEALMLQQLREEGLLSEYEFVFIPETAGDLQASKQLIQAVRWLLARAPPPFPLSGFTLFELVESALGREFSSRVSAHRRGRAAAGLSPQGPAPVILLYNAVLDYVAGLVTSRDLSRLSWPPGEFCPPDASCFIPHRDWNSARHLSWLRSSILSLQLPPWEPTGATDSWGELCSSIFDYAAALPSSTQSQPLLMSRLENLLERIRPKARAAKSSVSRVTKERPDEDAFGSVPWDDVVVICIDHKLKDWKIPEPAVCKDAVTADGEILVYVPAESSCVFQPPEEWTQAVRQTHKEKQLTESPSAAACFSVRQTLFPSLTEHVEATPSDITHTPTSEELLAHTVLQSLQEEKAESKRSMEQLQRWVDGDPVHHLSTPLFVPSSTLLSTPATIKSTPKEKAREAASTQQPVDDKQEDGALKSPPVPLMWRLKELERQILASKEEELACRLKLSELLSIVED